jgi:hypothetical protein
MPTYSDIIKIIIKLIYYIIKIINLKMSHEDEMDWSDDINDQNMISAVISPTKDAYYFNFELKMEWNFVSPVDIYSLVLKHEYTIAFNSDLIFSI